MSAIEVLKKWNNKSIIFDERFMTKEDYIEQVNLKVATQEAIVALEQREKLSKWLDDVEGFETKEFRDTLEKSLFGKLVGTCKVREIMNLKKERVGEQK